MQKKEAKDCSKEMAVVLLQVLYKNKKINQPTYIAVNTKLKKKKGVLTI